MFLRVLLLLIAVQWPAARLAAQRYTFKNYAAEAGLLNLNVRCMLQDKDGFLWLGTENGLFRYDGTRFEQMAIGDQSEMGLMRALWEVDGTVWASTDAIIYRFVHGAFEQVRINSSSLPYTSPNRLAPQDATHFAAIGKKNLLLASLDRATGIWSLSPYPDLPKSLQAAVVSAIAQQPGGALVVAAATGVALLPPHAAARWFPLPATVRWQTILNARDGSIWLRGGGRIVRIQPATGVVEDLSNVQGVSFANALSSSLAEDAQGRVLTPMQNGLARWEKDHWQVFGEQAGLPGYAIVSLMVDRQGNIWMSGYGHGLYRWIGYGAWESWNATSGLRSDVIWGIARDRFHRLWVATHLGIDTLDLDTGAVQHPKAFEAMPERVRAVASTQDGSVWFADNAHTVTRFDPATNRKQDFTLPAGHFNLHTARDGRLWITTERGLWFVQLESGAWILHAVDDPALSGQYLNELADSPDGELWIAGPSGLFHYDLHRWRLVDSSLGPWKGGFSNVESTAAGEAWLTGAFRGVVRVHVQQDRVTGFDSYVAPVIASDQVVQMRATPQGVLWIGTDAGISSFDGTRWRTYTMLDGLIWNDCDSFGLLPDADGSLWIGTSGGLSHLLHAGTTEELPSAPILVGARLAGTALQLPSGHRLDLPYTAGVLTLKFAQLDFRHESATRFRYRLSGEGDAWNVSADGEIALQRLSSGEYQIEVAAEDRQTGAISTPLVFDIAMNPPWWQSFWFNLVLVLTICLGVGGTFLWRDKVHKDRQSVLAQLVAERTHALEQETEQLRIAREALYMQATHDGLTGLWNRRATLEKLDGELERVRRDRSTLSVILLDLDRFKSINDNYGHLSGDLVLHEVASRLQERMRSYDTLGRYGGEELLILMPGLDAENDVGRTEALRASLSERPIHISPEVAIHISGSFGVCVVRGVAASARDVIDLADRALYRAKDEGRNRVVVTTLT